MRQPLSSLRTSSSRSARLALAAAAFAVFSASPHLAAAQEKAACDQFNWSIKREQALFKASGLETVISGATLDTLPFVVTLELQPHGTVDYVLAPGREPKTGESSGGLLLVTNVPKAGTYQVTASSEAWIDVIQKGKALDATAHTGRRDCADVRKSVRFDLEPGPLTIQVSGVDSLQIKLAVLPAE